MLSLSRRFEYDDVASKTDKVCRSESSTRRGNCHPRSPLIDASTAALARASASRRAAATAGIPVARSPTCAPAAANLASCSRAPDEDDAASCVCVFSPAVSFPPVATASVTAAASVAVGGSLVGGATPRLAKDTVGGVLDAASRDAGARERSPDLARVADRVFERPVVVLVLVLVGSASSSSGEPRFLRRQLRLSRRLDRSGRRRPRGGGGANPTRRVLLSRAFAFRFLLPPSAFALAGAGVRARAAADARGAAVAPFARLNPARLLARVLDRARGDLAARRVARRRRRRRSVVVVGTTKNNDGLLGGFVRAPARARGCRGKAPPP